MTDARRRGGWLVPAIVALLAACGGGGGGGEVVEPPPTAPAPPDPVIVTGTRLPADVHWAPPAGATPASGNYVYLHSEAGDPMGDGRVALYTDAESTIDLAPGQGGWQVMIGHPERQWTGAFVPAQQLQAGFYGGAQRPGSVSPGMLWTHEWRDCPAMDAWWVVDSIRWSNEGLEALEIRFTQRCQGAAAALRGKLRWERTAARSGPIVTPPAALWQPPSGATPGRGTYLYLESDADDYVGRGRTRLLTPRDATLDLRRISSDITFYNVVAIAGMERWGGSLSGRGEWALRRGYYPGVQRYPHPGIRVGAMGWDSDRRSCAAVNGWFMVDDVAYVGDEIVRIELRFEQRCDRARAALRGKLRWELGDVLPPPGPAAAPAGLWRPPAGSVPADGDHLYLQSEPGDPVGAGRTQLLTGAAAALSGTPLAGRFHARADGAVVVNGDFAAMRSVGRLQPGWYAELPSIDRREPALGGLSWRIDGRGCSESVGWVAIDRLDLAADGSVAGLDLRFEQRCAGAAGPLRGALRWTAPAANRPLPVPATLWRPPADRVPAQANHVYVESDYEDPIGQGQVQLSTPVDAKLTAGGAVMPQFDRSTFGALVQDGIGDWNLAVSGGLPAVPLVPGLYGNLRGALPFATGPTLEFRGRGRICPEASGWVAVDEVSYVGADLTAMLLRFEQHCDGALGTLRGQVRWSVDQPRPTPGPVATPAGLWNAPAGAMPPTGTAFYLESEYGDFVGQARTRLFTPAETAFRVDSFANDHRVTVALDSLAEPRSSWQAWFAPMEGLSQLAVGHYPRVGRLSGRNPTQAGLDVFGDGRGCNTLSGWLQVDSIAFAGGLVTAVELRFEQHCEEESATLRGKLRWTRP